MSWVDGKSTPQHYQINLHIPALLPGAALLLHYSVCAVILCYDLIILPVVFQVGKSYKAPYDNCTQYTCTESGGQFSLTSTVKVCLPFEESNCVPVSISELEKRPPEMSCAIALGDFFTLSTLFLDLFESTILFEGNTLFQLSMDCPGKHKKSICEQCTHFL